MKSGQLWTGKLVGTEIRWGTAGAGSLAIFHLWPTASSTMQALKMLAVYAHMVGQQDRAAMTNHEGMRRMKKGCRCPKAKNFGLACTFIGIYSSTRSAEGQPN